MNNQKGFTLIELIVVIVILGILSAVAVPKFLNVQTDAKIAVVKGMSGAVKTASSLVHSKALIHDVSTGYVDINNNSIATYADGDVYCVNGYPRADFLVKAIEDLGDFTVVSSQALLQLRLNGVDGCEVQYSTSTAAGSPSTVTIDTTNCN